MYALDPELAAIWDRWPPRVLISTVPCPACGRRATLDGIAREIICYHHEEARMFAYTDRLQAGDRSAPTDRPRLPDNLRQYYPHGVTCPADGSRLHLRLRDADGTCPDCGTTWTFEALRDAAARRIMAEQPLGARVYHRPRHG